jgi:hypothetical protein
MAETTAGIVEGGASLPELSLTYKCQILVMMVEDQSRRDQQD